MKNIIKLVVNESGDWKVLLLNGKVYDEGHNIPDYVWGELLQDLGHKMNIKEVTDEDLENGEY